jgi:hypothetical protein
MRSAIENRLAIVEQQNRELVRRLSDMGDLLARALNQVQLASGGGGGGGSSGGGAFVVLSPPAIAAGGFGVMDVYSVSGGATVLATTGATVYNEYNSPVAAGKVITLCRNNDGTYIVYGQSCL